MANLAQSPKAHPEDVGLQTIVADIRFDTASIGGGIQIGAIPANAIIHETRVHVLTAFNAATTNDITVGTAATGAQLMAAATAVAGTVGTKVQAGVASGSPLVAADQALFVRYVQAGTAATTGRALVVITFYPWGDYI